MADQTFEVTSGFYDAVDNDRLYTADQMNMPYKRLISNGVFATPQGTASTDLQVESAGDGLNIIVNVGNGIFADKWFESETIIAITVPTNTGIVPRFDSVIAQVDTRQSGRVASIVYRTGTPSSNPTPPDINTVTNVTEYRLANVYVAAGANTINNDAITDCRGSSECPWITSLVQQPDTSTLWNQYQKAYQDFYDKATTDYTEYVGQQRSDWEAFLQSLTSELDVTTNVVMLTSSYTATSSVTNIPINIPSYDPDTDILQVFINGLLAVGKYSLNSNKTSIDLNTAIASGNTVYFVVFKSVITGNVETVVTMIQKLDDMVANFMADGGWINFTLESGATVYNSLTPAVRCIGNRVYLRGAFKGITAAGTTICTLPVAYRPAIDHVFTSAAINGTSANDYVTISVSASSGAVKLASISGTITNTNGISIATTFLANAGLTVSMVYTYKGSVSTYADLPADADAGDVYMVQTADATEGIAAGDDVFWNGTEWELLNSVISSADIDSIIQTIE